MPTENGWCLLSLVREIPDRMLEPMEELDSISKVKNFVIFLRRADLRFGFLRSCFCLFGAVIEREEC